MIDDDNPVQPDHPRRDQRPQGELAGGRVTACARDQPGRADIIPVEFGQAIDGFGPAVPKAAVCAIAVPRFVIVRVTQPEIGGQIDDLQRLRQLAE